MTDYTGTAGSDFAWGTRGNDTIHGRAGHDVLKGRGGHDVIDGGAGDDLVLGGSGHDVLAGGAGDDWVLGGTGHDVLVYRAARNVGDCDVYLGGRGCDTLVLVLPAALGADDRLAAEIAAYRCQPSWSVFTFDSLGLTVQSLERLVVHVLEPEAPEEPGTRAPSLGDDALAIGEDATDAGTIDLLGNDTDPDGTALTVTSIDATGLVGRLTDLGDGTISYDPAGAFEALGAGESAVQTVTYTVRDGNGETASATLTITVEGTNDAPVVADVDLGETQEDTALAFTAEDLLAGATDADGDALAVARVSLDGTVLEADADGFYTLEPPENFNGTLTLDVVVTDGTAQVGTQATLAVASENDAPLAGAVATRTVAEDGSLTYTFDDLLAGATDGDGDALTVTAASGTNGTAIVDAVARTVTFTPDGDFNGDASFTFTVSDGEATDTGTASITVTSVNDGPAAGTVAARTVAEDGALVYSFADLLADATDVDGDTLTVTAAQGVNGTATVDAVAETVTFTPSADFNGDASFTFTVSDGEATDTGRADVSVTPLNDAPVVRDVRPDRVIAEDNSTVYSFAGLLGFASDADGDALTITGVEGVNGTATVDAVARTVTFTPVADFNGEASFTFTVSDGQASDTGTATIIVAAANDAPVVRDVQPDRIIPEDGSTVYSLAGLLRFASDVDGDALAVTAVEGVNGAAVLDLDAGTVTFTPDADFAGEASFTFTVSDGEASDAGRATIVVSAVNDAPVVRDVQPDRTILEDGSTVYSLAGLLRFASDVDGDALAVTAVEGVNGTAVLDLANERVVFTPDADFVGDASFTFTVSDGTASDTGTATIIVAPVNDAPMAADVSPDRVILEDGSTTYSFAGLLAGATDVDGDALTITAAQGVNGTATLDAGNETVTFTPDADFNGEASFTFTVSDGLATDTGTAGIVVVPVDDAPRGPLSVALPDSLEDEDVTISVAQLLEGMSDPEGEALTLSDLSVSNGRLFDNEDGTYTYDPNPDDDGEVTFSYTVGDGTTQTARTATLDLVPVNDDPALGATLTGATGSVRNGQGFVTVNYTFTTGDADGDPVTVGFAPGGEPTIGTSSGPPVPLESVFDQTAGTLTVTFPDTALFDVDFTLQASDGQGGTTDTDVWFARGPDVDFRLGQVRSDATQAEIINGLETADTIVGGGGHDTITGNGGDDTLIGGARGDLLRGGTGDDRISGGGGVDDISGGAGADALFGQDGDDVIFGGDGADELRGGGGDDNLRGGSGNDLVVGEAGADRLFGEAGADRLFGNGGDDELYGGDGADELFAGAGDDYLSGGDGADILSGGAGADTFRIEGDEGYGGRDTITDYERGIDTLQLDIFRPNGEVVPLTRSQVLATETFDGDLYTYSFGDTSFSTRAQILASDIEVV